MIPQATEQYQELIKLLPAEFVGSPARLVPLAQLLCTEMGAAFAARALTCPPWRQAKSLLSKWLPAKARIPQVQPSSSSAPCALLSTPTCFCTLPTSAL